MADVEKVGGIVGEFKGFIYECKNDGVVRGGNYVGGIIGNAFGENTS